MGNVCQVEQKSIIISNHKNVQIIDGHNKDFKVQASFVINDFTNNQKIIK